MPDFFSGGKWIFQFGIQKISDAVFVLRHECYVVVIEDFVKFTLASSAVSMLPGTGENLSL